MEKDKQCINSVSEKAPSNIALIKYMGKLLDSNNTATNPSLSYTLINLITSVVIKKNFNSDQKDLWKSLDSQFLLSSKGQVRFLKHWEYLKEYFKIKGSYTILSSNNFPTACGLASSASSFAALTKAAYKISLANNGEKKSLLELAKLSRRGSGSSCRSLFSPWVQWEGDTIQALKVDKEYLNLEHSVLLISSKEKKISSSEAHRRVLKHCHFFTRVKKVECRFLELKKLLLQPNQFLAIQKLVWEEFIDMHHLFETCPEPFSYFTEQVKSILKDLNAFININQIKVWVTMDAGPNIHFLYKSSESLLLKQYLSGVTKKYNLADLTSFKGEDKCLK